MSEDLTKKLHGSDDEKIALILTTVQNLDTRIDNAVQNLITRVENLEQKVEERLYDTRPIWQKLVADIAQLQEGQAQLQEGQKRLESEVREIKVSVRDIDRKMSVMNDTLVAIQADYKDIDNRMHELELRQGKPSNSPT